MESPTVTYILVKCLRRDTQRGVGGREMTGEGEWEKKRTE